MSQVSASNLDSGPGQDASEGRLVKAEPHEREGHPGKQKKSKGPPKKRDTHFLCFPLVTDTSIPQLAKSLQHFREVTTKPGRDVRSRAERDNDGQPASQVTTDTSTESGPSQVAEPYTDDINSNTNLAQFLPVSNPDLQILPGIAHRPPGTFHLTLGVMDLSTKEEMDRALTLLRDMDLAGVFRGLSASRGDPLNEQRQDSSTMESLRNLNPVDESNSIGTELNSIQRPVSPPPISRTSFQISPELGAENPPKISLTGLSTFPSAKSSRVFFAKPSPSLTSLFPLLEFGQAIRRRFREAGFITETRPLVLHATVANMRYAVQARGGRTSKGKSWRYGKDRWTDGQVDAREIIKCFDHYGGDVAQYTKGVVSVDEAANEFVWADNIVIDRVAICKMGAEKTDDEVLGMVYPPVGQKLIFS